MEAHGLCLGEALQERPEARERSFGPVLVVEADGGRDLRLWILRVETRGSRKRTLC